jgi:3-oxosteroid 1-dehydrogenase
VSVHHSTRERKDVVIENSQGLPDTWDEEADLVVVGSGAGALTGAVVAAADGASVILLEKANVVGGTTAVSGGGFWIADNQHMSESGVEDSREEALAYMRACAGNQGDDEHIVALVDTGPEMVSFLEDRTGMKFRAWPATGGTIDYRPWLLGWKPGARTLDPGKFRTADLGAWGEKVRLGAQSAWTMDKLDYYRSRGHVQPLGTTPPRQTSLAPGEVPPVPEYLASGTALIGQLLKGCLEQGVTLYTETPAKELLVRNGRVVGVRAERDGEPVYVRARRGVLMASGGYGVSEELKREWLTRPLEATCDVESNTGDGHLMGNAIGAGLAGLGDAWWMPHMAAGRNPDGSTFLAGSREDRSVPHTLIVNRRGKRFMNEAMNYYDACEPFGTKEGGSPRNYPAWYIFDSQAREKYSVVAFKFPGGDVPEWMVTADSVVELADRLELGREALQESLDRFNVFARAGRDDDFERGANEWDLAWGDPNHDPNPSLGTVEKPPFYALEIRSGALATRGGLRVNASAQVLSALPPFDPIPGLYGAGNCTNGAVAGAYVGAGATIGAAMTFGFIAALRVAGGVDAPGPAVPA